jgi:hypothetical protein
MRIDSIRVTELDSYENCSYCFFLQKIGVRQTPNKNLELGSAVHRAIEEYHTLKKHTFIPAIEPFVLPYISTYDDAYTHCEYKFSLPFPKTTVILTGTIDLIKDFWIFEHKTASSRYTQQQVDIHKQVTAYSYAFKQIFQKDPSGIRFNVIVKNKTPVLQTLDTWRDERDYEIWKDWVREILENIKHDKFEPNYGARWHNYAICPASVKI